jgi:hypothetical protein
LEFHEVDATGDAAAASGVTLQIPYGLMQKEEEFFQGLQ